MKVYNKLDGNIYEINGPSFIYKRKKYFPIIGVNGYVAVESSACVPLFKAYEMMIVNEKG